MVVCKASVLGTGSRLMEINFLGTSSGWPLPRIGCDCNICTSKDVKDTRFRPSVLVNKEILIDAPPDIYHELKKHKIDATKIKTILLTHAHDDHIMGLYDLSHVYNKDQKISVISTENVLKDARRKLGISLFSFKTEAIKPFKRVKLANDTSVFFIPVVHTVEAYAIKIKAPKPIFYAPEFRRIKPSSKKALGDIELAIIDGSSKTKRGQAKGHETIEEGIRMGKEIKAKRIFFTNIGHKTDRHEALSRFVKEEGGDKFGIAFDGLTIKL